MCVCVLINSLCCQWSFIALHSQYNAAQMHTHTHTHTHTHIYIYIHIYICVHFGSIPSLIHIWLNNIDIFFVYTFLYLSFQVAVSILWYPAGIGLKKPSIINWFPRTFCSILDHHQIVCILQKWCDLCMYKKLKQKMSVLFNQIYIYIYIYIYDTRLCNIFLLLFTF